MKTTIGLNREATAAIDSLRDRFGFREDRDVAHLALAYALKNGIDPIRNNELGSFGGAGNKTWSVAALDRGLERLVTVFHPDLDEPFTAIETLISKAAVEINLKYEEGDLDDLSDLLG